MEEGDPYDLITCERQDHLTWVETRSRKIISFKHELQIRVWAAHAAIALEPDYSGKGRTAFRLDQFFKSSRSGRLVASRIREFETQLLAD